MNTHCINVLIIEDNAGDARLVREALKGASQPSFEVEWVDRLSKGTARLVDGGIDVLLLDLGLPDSQGLAGLATLQAVAPSVPVVVLSGAADERIAVDAVHAGAQDYLVKGDVHRHLLVRALRYAVERKRADQALRESGERLRLALSAANGAIWEYHPAEGFLRWNKTGNVITSWPLESGASAELGIPGMDAEDHKRVLSSFLEALEGQAISWSAEYRILRGDGKWSYVQDCAVITRDHSGKAIKVVGVMLDVGNLKSTEEALRESNSKLHRLSRDLLRSQDYERRRIARELHDSTSQLLAALGINLSRLRDSALDTARRGETLTEAIELAAACSMEIRTVTYLLHPPLLDEIGLVSALHAYVQGFKQRTGIEVQIEVPRDFGRLSNEMEATLFRIVQEGLANVHKHSGSPLAVIRLERDSREVRFFLEDRGHGLPDALRDEANGFVRFGVGIMGMSERAQQLGGRLELTSNDKGARVAVTLPLVRCNEKDTIVVSG